jgi:hypothetical protein
MHSLESRLRALEGRIVGTDEGRVLALLVRAQQGDAEAREALERLPNRDEVLGGLIAVYLGGPADGTAADEGLDASEQPAAGTTNVLEKETIQ